MIEAFSVCKTFEDIKAVDSISVSIKDGNVFGLIGTNGAGKSTFMRMLSGVLQPDSGKVLIDGTDVFENVEAKEKLFYISDSQYFFANATPNDMKHYYRTVYKNYDEKRFDDYLERFELHAKRKINTFSKGMKKQLSLICGICANTRYLMCDETFDGLDPVMRQGIKSIFASEMEERGLTPIIASHNLRELEDICDHIGLLHKGGILLSKDLEDMKCNIHKVQGVFDASMPETELFAGIEVLKCEKRGSLYTITLRGNRDEIMDCFRMKAPIFFEMLPLSLEEIFISETEVVGYDIKKLIL